MPARAQFAVEIGARRPGLSRWRALWFGGVRHRSASYTSAMSSFHAGTVLRAAAFFFATAPVAMMPARASEIVAIGASNTAGYGVGRDQAYPAQLQSMLRAKGLSVQVANAGVSGDTSAGMLARLQSAVPAGTRVAVLDPGNNDLKACSEPWRPQKCATSAQRAATIASIRSRLRARGVSVLMANIEFNLIPIAHWQPDRRHLTAEGHRIIASRLVDKVAAALGSKAR
jgi:acyl-CoA thioesterase I